MSGPEAGKEMAAMMEAGTPESLSIGAQGTMINFEVSLRSTLFAPDECVRAAAVFDHHRGTQSGRHAQEGATI